MLFWINDAKFVLLICSCFFDFIQVWRMRSRRNYLNVSRMWQMIVWLIGVLCHNVTMGKNNAVINLMWYQVVIITNHRILVAGLSRIHLRSHTPVTCDFEHSFSVLNGFKLYFWINIRCNIFFFLCSFSKYNYSQYIIFLLKSFQVLEIVWWFFSTIISLLHFHKWLKI